MSVYLQFTSMNQNRLKEKASNQRLCGQEVHEYVQEGTELYV